MKIAIVTIAYNRLDSLQRLLSSLDSAYYNRESVTLVISIDKSTTDAIEKYADAYLWNWGEKLVITHSENLGLRKHILSCGDLLYKYDAIIVLEDDVVVAPSFYLYAKQAIDFYKTDKRIAGISLYNFSINYQNQIPFVPLQGNSDVYFMNCAQSWGQVWMREQWNEFMCWYEKNSEEFTESPAIPKTICSWPKSSWLKYHTKYCIEKNKYFVYPYLSLSTNYSDVGTHVKGHSSTLFQVRLLWDKKEYFKFVNMDLSMFHYDGFFESKFISRYLGISNDEICVDFYGMKHNVEGKRYWLTREYLNYEIIRSYALSMKPYELNIIYNIKGEELFVYDTYSRIINARGKYKINFSWVEYLYTVTFKQYIKSLFGRNWELLAYWYGKCR